MARHTGFLKPSSTAPQRGSAMVNVEEVAKVAYELYEQRGRVDGHDLDDWLKAETIVRRTQNGRAASSRND